MTKQTMTRERFLRLKTLPWICGRGATREMLKVVFGYFVMCNSKVDVESTCDRKQSVAVTAHSSLFVACIDLWLVVADHCIESEHRNFADRSLAHKTFEYNLFDFDLPTVTRSRNSDSVLDCVHNSVETFEVDVVVGFCSTGPSD
jgi:hypothetical protein